MSVFTNPETIPRTVKLPKSRNFAQDIVYHGCARPWYVYVEAFIPAFIELLITIWIVDLDDIVRAYGEYQAGTRGSGKRKHFRRGGQTVSVDVPTAAERWSLKGLQHVIRVTAPLEAFGFGFLLLGAADQFFGRWQSLIEESSFCTAPLGTGPFSRRGVSGPLIISPTGQGFGYPELEQNRGAWGNTAFSVSIPNGNVFMFATLKGTAGQAGLSNAALRLTVQRGVFTDTFDSEFLSAGPNEPLEFIVKARFRVPLGVIGQIEWSMVGDGQIGGVIAENGSVFAMIETDL